MEFLSLQHQPFSSEPYFMNPISCKLTPPLRIISTISTKFRLFSTSSQNLTTTQTPIREQNCIKTSLSGNTKVKAKVLDTQLKENWLDSLTCPFPERLLRSDSDSDSDGQPSNEKSGWVMGIDPDVHGALAVLKTDCSGCSAQVFDSPHLKVLVGSRIRRRLDARSIVQLLESFDAPMGTTAYIEQSIPFPQDGKLGWWGGGFAYGLWIGVLVASGFSVVPVSSALWKNEFKLSGNRSSKDDSRELASTLFPSMSALLRRKKDHGRAEALLIAAYGKGLKVSADSSGISQELGPLN